MVLWLEVVLEGLEKELDPRRGSEVDCLCDIIASRKARVIGLRECHDELPFSLDYSVNGDSVFLFQKHRVQAGEQVVHAVGLFLVNMGVFLPHSIVHLLFVRTGDSIPDFRASEMHVIDRVHVGVLHVPAETGENHAHVNPGVADPGDQVVLGSQELEQRVRGLVNVVEVERGVPGCVEALYELLLSREARSVALGREVIGVPYLNFGETYSMRKNGENEYNGQHQTKHGFIETGFGIKKGRKNNLNFLVGRLLTKKGFRCFPRWLPAGKTGQTAFWPGFQTPA